MNGYFNDIMSTIHSSIETMNMDVFNQLLCECEQVLKKGKKIVVSGLGKNVPVCDKFVGTMNSIGLEACYMNTNSAVHGDLGMVKQGDLVIILTKSGETVESVYLTKLLKQRKANLWLLSFSNESTLSCEIPKRLILELDNEGDLWNIAPNNSTTINLIILQGLAWKLAERMGVTLDQFKDNHPGGAIGKSLRRK